MHMWKQKEVQSKCDLISCHTLTYSSPFVSQTYGRNNNGDETLQTESVISSLHIDNKLKEWETVSDLCKRTLNR